MTTPTGQFAGSDELVVLVDADDREVGTAEKLAAHREGRLHRAVSVFIVDGDRILLQQRSEAKHIFRDLWANTACTHPRPGEDPVTAGRRRLEEEMGIDTKLVEVGTFSYRAHDPATGLEEAEFDHVLAGSSSAQPDPDPAEVSGYQWIGLVELRRGMVLQPDTFAPWLAPALDILTGSGWLRERERAR